MRLKPTGNLAKAALGGALALTLFAAEGLLLTYFVAVGDWGALLNPLAFFGAFFVLILGIVNVFAVAWPFVLLWRERNFQEAAAHDERHAPRAAIQPDAQLALRDGETLVLERRRPPAKPWRDALTAVFLVLLVAGFGEFLIVALLPPLDPLYTLFHFNAPAPTPPSLPDWLAAAFPIALGAFLGAATLGSAIAGGRYRIVADDRGVTIRVPLRRPRTIPWDDILIFARTSENAGTYPEGVYVLWGRRHLLQVEIPGPESEAHDGPSNAQNPAAGRYRYPGGYEAYATGARRLLGAVAVRGRAELHAFDRATKALGGIKRRFPATAVELADALAAPVAAPGLQPSPTAIPAPAAGQFGGVVVALRPRIAHRGIVAESLLWFLALGVPSLACTGGYLLPGALSGNPTDMPVALGVFGLGVPLIGFASGAFAYARRRAARPTVIADEAGVRSETGQSSTNVSIPWAAIRAWAVVPPDGASHGPATYIIFAADKKLSWREPTDAELAGRLFIGDRRAAYREHAAQLHALIAARTGLPLREIRLDAPPATPPR